MKRLRDKQYRCSCGTLFEEVAEDGADILVYNALTLAWETECPACGCPNTRGQLEERDWEEDLDAAQG